MPQDQHYIPVFYLRRWVGSDGRLCVYSRQHGSVKPNRKYPTATGFAEDLYAIGGAGAEIESHLEGQFFRIADNEAASVLDILETESRDLSDGSLRSGWSRFVMTLLHRNPESVAMWQSKAEEVAAQARDKFRTNYASLRRPSDPEKFEDYPLKELEYYAARTTVDTLQKMMDHKQMGDHLNRMAWAVVRLKSSHSLLTSDRPLVMTNGIGYSDSHFAMPVGPQRLFIAANDQRLAHHLARQDHDELATTMNNEVTRQARKFVWGLDDTQLRFVERRLGEMRRMTPADPISSLESGSG
jgi:hypothetical protein